jgi:hypothetical protein
MVITAVTHLHVYTPITLKHPAKSLSFINKQTLIARIFSLEHLLIYVVGCVGRSLIQFIEGPWFSNRCCILILTSNIHVYMKVKNSVAD